MKLKKFSIMSHKIINVFFGVALSSDEFIVILKKYLPKDVREQACNYVEIRRGKEIAISMLYNENFELIDKDDDYKITPEHLLFNERLLIPLRKMLIKDGLDVSPIPHGEKNEGMVVIGKKLSTIKEEEDLEPCLVPNLEWPTTPLCVDVLSGAKKPPSIYFIRQKCRCCL